MIGLYPSQRRAERRAARKKGKLILKGITKQGPMYTVAVDVSSDGKSFSTSLTTAKPETYYFVRAQVTQHVGEPRIQGFKILWSIPTGWVWVDGIGSTSYEEAMANPLPVIRKVKSPLVMEKVTFGSIISDYYV